MMSSHYDQSETQQFSQYSQSPWNNSLMTDQYDDSSLEHDELVEDDLVAMMSGNHDVSAEEHYADVPSQDRWYHGTLERRIAVERLLEVDIPGCYLVRESDRQPGSYVLSFLSKQSGITHFRITSICGDFYVGGRQFESLEDLIAFYTHGACLLEGEILKHPVPPPEPVDYRRRVQAILPYQKVPDADNDELSFEQDDVFIVHNDMENDWLWVTSQRTNESGCVFRGLVREVNSDVDPHEGKEWFHGNISKDQALNLLSAVGKDGSFLIRESESTRGCYALYLYYNYGVQRYRIFRKTADMFEMGGRSYESIDDIVDHYKTEQIAEGQTLIQAIPRSMDISKECRVDIYQSLSDSTASDQLASRAIINDSGIIKKGQLYKKGMGKKGQDTKKWKQMFFVLHGEKRHLYYFEHERKTKPKGLFDLGYGAVYPVHESYFGRPHCFQVVIRALNEISSSYFCAESSELAQEWMRLLRGSCAPPNCQPLPQPNSARQVRSVHVVIEESRKLVCRTSCRPYCMLSLNTVHVGRTKVKEGLQPLWSEEFIFDEIPPDVDSITVGVHNASKKSKHSSVGEVAIHFSKLSSGKYVDDWYNLVPSAGFSASNVSSVTSSCGSIRVRARYCNELIMPTSEYDLLKELVTTDMKVILALTQICGQDRTLLASVLLKIFRQQKVETELIRMLNDREINAAESEPGTLFRSTTLASTLMEQYMRSTCVSFVSLALNDVVKQIVESKQSCELNPAKLKHDEDVTTHCETLLSYLNGILASILVSESIFPKGLRYVFGHLQHSVSEKWPDDPLVRVRAVSGFMFLRLICPAILNPKMFNMVSETPSPIAARSLLLVAKAMQNLANLVEFGAKEPHMECLNSFIFDNKAKFISFIEGLGNKNISESEKRLYVIDRVCQLQPSMLSSLSSGKHLSDVYKIDVTRDLASLYQICKEHLPALQALSNKEASLKRLLGVIELLNKQQAAYQQRLRHQDD